jgi:hypothetical protein
VSSASIVTGHELFKQLLENKAMTPFQGPDVLIPLETRAGQFFYFFVTTRLKTPGDNDVTFHSVFHCVSCQVMRVGSNIFLKDKNISAYETMRMMDTELKCIGNNVCLMDTEVSA